ncbi:hypothetical protein CN505_28230 [Bacillus cereus]|nr:hypothetical protein CN509_23945 [Bacillus cereus]PES97752.1 hypothetical protein CN505_28230 [Bacillus cereus]
MEKQRLIESLKEGRVYTRQHDQYMRKLNKDPSVAPGCLLAILVPILYLSMSTSLSFFGIAATIGLSFAAFFVWLVVAMIMKESRSGRFDEEIAHLDQQFQEHMQIPIKYFTTTQINHMIESLERGAADTLKEAIDIWDRHEANEKRNRLAEEQIEATNEAAEAARATTKAAKKATKEAENIRNDNIYF